ncbi:MAG: hypothetical protein R6W99_09860, partial [Clostridia bacterium]
MKTRKLLAIVLAVAMLASFVSVPAFAEGEGEALETLGILVGTGDGVTPEYLASTATRAQAALIHLRLFGLNDEALAFNGTETFTDAATATEYWQPILEYLKANPEFGWNGYVDGSFIPNGSITGHEFMKVLLVALGYDRNEDFTWETVMTVAATIGLTSLADKEYDDLTVEDLAIAIVEALGTKMNSVLDITLLTWLVLNGVVDEADAIAAGFEVEEPAFVIVSAGPTATDEVTVVMSTDVPDGTVVTLKKGTVGIVVNKTVTGDTIVLKGLYNFYPGTYTVTVDDETATFAIMTQTAADLTIGATTVFLAANQDLMVKLSDQYGDAMSLSGTNYSIFNQNNGWVFAPTTIGTTLKINATDGGTTTAHSIYVFVYDPVSQQTASKEIAVIKAPYIAAIEFGAVILGGSPTPARLYTGSTGNKLIVTAIDQYNKPYVLTSADVQTGALYTNKIQLLSSNNDVIDASLMEVIDGKLVFPAGDPGVAMITGIIPDQSFIATSQMITVYATPVLTTLQASAPGAVYAMEQIVVPATGYDQYGSTATFTPTSNIMFTVTNPTVLPAGNILVTANNTIKMTAIDDGTVTIFYFLNGILQGSFDVTVQPVAYPFQITAVTAPGALETGASYTLANKDFTVIDQYGRVMKTPFAGAYTWVVEKISDTTNNVALYGTDVLSTAGLVAGTDSFVAYLSTGGAKVLESAFQFSVRNVSADEINAFAMKPITGPMYLGPNFAKWGAAPADYYKYVEITGKVGTLDVVLLDADDD